ncbi:MAG TPA: hypothetical protein VI504_00200 [Candidatus Eisenbacteria bacterium]|jgi:hypothetical protein
MSYEVRKEAGANWQVVGGFADEASAKAAALAACTSRAAEFIVYDAKSFEIGRAVFHDGAAEWRGPGGSLIE